MYQEVAWTFWEVARVVSMLLAVLVAAGWFVRREVKREREWQRVKAKIARLEPRWMEVSNEGVSMIMRADDYRRARDAHRFDMAERPWERVRFWVVPGFCFWHWEVAQNYMQIGGPKEYDTLCRELVRSARGLTQTEIQIAEKNSSGYPDFKNRLLGETKQVYVPFTNRALAHEDQARMYPRYTLEDVKAYLLNGTPLPVKK